MTNIGDRMMAGDEDIRSECLNRGEVFIGRNRHVLEVLKLAQRVASTSTPVFIHGESGTGKEHLARFIHCQSPRRRMPLVKIDCAAIPPDLVESELFGFEPGAFTGATKAKPGRLERGDNATILLDNITAVEVTTQAKLTRVIQDGYFERLGGFDHIHINTRFITCSLLEPSLAIYQGLLRKDLYYRLGVICLGLPPLRERREDIPLLVEHFLAVLPESKKQQYRISQEAMTFLTDYHWPGNIRQLINVLQRTLITCEGLDIALNDIRITHFNLENDIIATASQRNLSLAELEKLYIQAILQKTVGNKSAAAQILGINRKTLLEKRKKYRLK
ncbi:sigma-54-dependent Fis family transcriptional regulator [bacterium]|nr:sigma-54-dependent Fis family transcriptional regulator [candidate division CSSED10-310 bacterium]